MKKLGLFEAKNRLSELVERAQRGEKTAITRRGKLAALIVPAQPATSLEEIFDNIEGIRKRARMPRGVSIEDLVREGRR